MIMGRYLIMLESTKMRAYITKLLERDGNTCAVCGRTLDIHNCVINHIYPRSLGGGDNFENLELLCVECNTVKSASDQIYEYQFESFIKELLERHPKYSNIRVEHKTPIGIIDIAFDSNVDAKRQFMFAEIKVYTAFTNERINAIIHQLALFKSEYPYGKAVFIFPGELADEYTAALMDAGISIWDSEFLCEEFKDQIDELKESRYSYLIQKMLPKLDEKDEYQKLIDRLKDCVPGSSEWGKYQKLVGDMLELLFCKTLSSPLMQSRDFSKNNRRDFILLNATYENSIWRFLRDRYDAEYIIVDAKNSDKPITKQDILQMSHYLKEKGSGRFGIIISRKGLGKSSQIALRDTWIHEEKMIVVLDDNDVETMLKEMRCKNDPAIILRQKVAELRLSI